MAKWETYIRYPKEDILDKEGEEIKLIIRDTEEYVQRPVIAKVYKDWREGLDKLRVLDPLGRHFWGEDELSGIEIIKVEDEYKLADREYHKAGIKV